MAKRGPKKKEISASDLVKIEQWAGRGLTQEQIAALLDMCEATFYKRIEEAGGENSEIVKHIKKGKAKACEDLTNKLYEKAMAGSEASIFFALKCKYGWREKVEHVGSEAEPVHVHHKHSGSVDVKTMNTDELLNEIKSFQ